MIQHPNHPDVRGGDAVTETDEQERALYRPYSLQKTSPKRCLYAYRVVAPFSVTTRRLFGVVFDSGRHSVAAMHVSRAKCSFDVHPVFPSVFARELKSFVCFVESWSQFFSGTRTSECLSSKQATLPHNHPGYGHRCRHWYNMITVANLTVYRFHKISCCLNSLVLS